MARRSWGAGDRHSPPADRHVFDLDAHEKLLWTQPPVAHGFVSARHAVPAGLKQFYRQGCGGHVLSCETHSGDAHLSEQLRPIIEHFEQAIGRAVVHVLVADREGLRADVLVELPRRKKAFLQHAACEACARFNRARIRTVTGQVISLAVLDCQ